MVSRSPGRVAGQISNTQHQFDRLRHFVWEGRQSDTEPSAGSTIGSSALGATGGIPVQHCRPPTRLFDSTGSLAWRPGPRFQEKAAHASKSTRHPPSREYPAEIAIPITYLPHLGGWAPVTHPTRPSRPERCRYRPKPGFGIRKARCWWIPDPPTPENGNHNPGP